MIPRGFATARRRAVGHRLTVVYAFSRHIASTQNEGSSSSCTPSVHTSISQPFLRSPPLHGVTLQSKHAATVASAPLCTARRLYATPSNFSHGGNDSDSRAEEHNTSSNNSTTRRREGSSSGIEDEVPDGAYRTTMPWATPEDDTVDNVNAGTPSATTTTANNSMNPNDATSAASSAEDSGCGGAGRADDSDSAAAAFTLPQSVDTESADLQDMAQTLTKPHSSIVDTKENDHDFSATTTSDSPPATTEEVSNVQSSTSASPCPWDDGGAGLVHRRIAQWYVPGLEREHRRLASAADRDGPTVKLSEVVSEVVTVALKGSGNPEDHQNPSAKADTKTESRTAAAGADTKAHEAVSGVAPSSSAAAVIAATPSPLLSAAAATSQTTAAEPAQTAARTRAVAAKEAAASSPKSTSASAAAAGAAAETAPSSAEERTPSSTATLAKPKTTSASSEERKPQGNGENTTTGSAAAGAAVPPATDTKVMSAESKQAEKAKGKSAQDKEKDDDDDVDDEELPKTLLTVQANRNKRMKRLLIAGLGADFAKAGLSNDGVRTSFSVVNYQTIKQLTGLERIPSALLISCLVAPENQFSWIDISMHPTATLSEYKEALEEVLLGLGMHRTMVEDSAEPMLLPQVTVTKGCYSLLMRYAIEAPANKQMDSFQDLTNRFTVFLSQKRIITVHRTQCSYVEELKLNWQHYLSGEGLDGAANGQRSGNHFLSPDRDSSPTPRGLQYLMYYFVKETVGTFTQAIAKCIVEFDRYEANLFNTQRNRSSMARDIYHIKRRASVYGRTLTLTQDAYAHIASALHISTSQVGYQEIMHDLAHVESLAEELNSNADSVLQLLFQLSSYQVNELMRVLTLFSAFFIPLSFIASVYGMNFEDLPMLHNEYGGVFCAVLMCTVATCIFLWFRSNRFI